MTSLLPIWRAAVEASHGFLTSEDVDWYEKLVASFLPRMRDLRVAVDENDVALGVIAQDAGEIQMLFVSPEAQGRGVGSALLEHVAQGQPELRLDVNEQNPSALAFYTAKGFTQVGRSEVDGQGRPFPIAPSAQCQLSRSAPLSTAIAITVRGPSCGTPLSKPSIGDAAQMPRSTRSNRPVVQS